MNAFVAVSLAALAAGAIFAAFFLLARRLNNYGIVDIVWSYAFAAIATFYALTGSGWPIRRAMVTRTCRHQRLSLPAFANRSRCESLKALKRRITCPENYLERLCLPV